MENFLHCPPIKSNPAISGSEYNQASSKEVKPINCCLYAYKAAITESPSHNFKTNFKNCMVLILYRNTKNISIITATERTVYTHANFDSAVGLITSTKLYKIQISIITLIGPLNKAQLDCFFC